MGVAGLTTSRRWGREPAEELERCLPVGPADMAGDDSDPDLLGQAQSVSDSLGFHVRTRMKGEAPQIIERGGASRTPAPGFMRRWRGVCPRGKAG